MRDEREHLAIIVELDDPDVRRQLAALLASDSGPARLMIEARAPISYLVIAPLSAELKCKPLGTGSWTPSLGKVKVSLERTDEEPADNVPGRSTGRQVLDGGGWISGPSTDAGTGHGGYEYRSGH